MNLRSGNRVGDSFFKEKCRDFYNGEDVSSFREPSSISCVRYANRRLLYGRTDDPTRKKRISQDDLSGCLEVYNKGQHDQKTLAQIMESTCGDENKDEKDEYNVYIGRLLQYADALGKQASVDRTIHDFMTHLIFHTNVGDWEIREIFNGAYVIIQGDKGHTFSIFREKGIRCDTRKLIPDSSHDTIYESGQYRIGKSILYDLNGDVSSNFDLLIGRSILPTCYGDTWFQFEKSRLFVEKPITRSVGIRKRLTSSILNLGKSILSAGSHGIDYVKYKISGNNQGPFGYSMYTEYSTNELHYPLVLKYCNDCLFRKKQDETVQEESREQFKDCTICGYKEIRDWFSHHFNSYLSYVSFKKAWTIPKDNILQDLQKDKNNKLYFLRKGIENLPESSYEMEEWLPILYQIDKEDKDKKYQFLKKSARRKKSGRTTRTKKSLRLTRRKKSVQTTRTKKSARTTRTKKSYRR